MLPLIWLLTNSAVAQPPAPTNLVCEWRKSPATVSNPCPEFAWEADGQARYEIEVTSADHVWKPGWIDSRVPVAEFGDPPLHPGVTYTWRVRAADEAGGISPWSEPQQLAYEPVDLPRRLPHIRTFVNFGGDPQAVAEHYDMTFRSDAKQFRDEIITLNYSLLCTMVIPSEKADALEQYCVERGVTDEGILEEMFIHFSRDTEVTLHVGAERAENPRETRAVPGWNPGSADASATEMKQSRVPIYYWGPPRDDFVMNVGHPEYQRFCAEVYAPSRLIDFDGIWVDTMPGHVPGPGQNAAVGEYPSDRPGKWRDDMLRMLVTIKRSMPDTPILANSWDCLPFVIDGVEHENWLNVSAPLARVESALAAAVDRSRRGVIQMLQVNPVHDPDSNEFGVEVDVDPDRDRIFALGLYYLIAGERTYFGYGQHPYARSEEKWFPAIEFDVGEPAGEMRVFAESPAASIRGESLLANGDFETGLSEWQIVDPVVIDSDAADTSCARIDSESTEINNINKQFVTLKPHTTYTLSARIRTDAISGGSGAQVYPYEFDDATGAGIGIVARGTRDWSEMSQVLTTGEDIEGRITFRVYGSTGTAWFDDIRLVEGNHGPWRVLARDYENALVLVKPFAGGSFDEDSASTHALPGPKRPLSADGTLGDPVSEITLRGGEAAILVGQ